MNKTKDSTRVLAIDPGYERLGAAVVEKNLLDEKIVYSTCIITPRTKSFAERLVILGDEFESLIKKYKPQLVAIEKLFFASNKKTASAVSEVRGMLLYLASKHELPIIEYTPLEIKSTITGHGRADKSQVTEMVKRIVTLEKVPKYDDEYDAIALGLTTLARLSTILE